MYAVPDTRSLPQELCDLIIDELRRDKTTLRSCTLVSQAWVFSARRYLFANIVRRVHQGVEDFLYFLCSAPLSVVLNLRILTLTGRGHVHLRDLAAVLNRLPSLSHLYLRWITVEKTHGALITTSPPTACRVHTLGLSHILLSTWTLQLILLYIHPSELIMTPTCKRTSSWNADPIPPAPPHEPQLSHDELIALSAGLNIHKADIHDAELVALTMQRFPVPLTFSAVVFYRFKADAVTYAKTILKTCGTKLTSLTLYPSTTGNEAPIGRLLGLDGCPHIEHFALTTLDLYPTIGLVESALAEIFKNSTRTEGIDFQLTCPDISFGAPGGAGALDKVLGKYVPSQIRMVTIRLHQKAPGFGAEDRRQQYPVVIKLPSKDRQDAMRAMMRQVTRSAALRFSI
ncbi:hypothetical protein PsYK624_103370 [Phanerochaete sordida]|uniref:F-box domain-containing protein n=1 Tax=Phanerochaete sordida TaxID=48140 RepID=A0A9P3GH29_9APHY|nr:hypothetical protein PsYK624_103370 [Phanerochaete sordida]